MSLSRKQTFGTIILLGWLICGTANAKTIPVEQRAAVRAEINQTAEEIIAAMIADDPGLKQALVSGRLDPCGVGTAAGLKRAWFTSMAAV